MNDRIFGVFYSGIYGITSYPQDTAGSFDAFPESTGVIMPLRD